MTPQSRPEPATIAEDTLIPRHIGFILDGNRRWAREQGLPTLEGHKRGYEILKDIGEAALDRGVQYLSAFVFSTENWKRSKEEVNYLMKLAYWVATHELEEMHKKNIRVKFLGERTDLSPKLLEAIDKAEAKTAKNTKGTLALCFNYGGQQEIATAAAKMIKEDVKPEEVTPEKVAEYLYEPEIPPIDLVIRTSGEQRLSNFMLWRAAYAELLFVKKHWPDFNEGDLDAAISEYASRNRRFGGN